VLKSLNHLSPLLGAGDFSEIYLEETRALGLHWEDGKLESVSSSHDAGIGLRYFQQLETRYAHASLARPFDLLQPSELEKLHRLRTDLTRGLGQGTPRALSVPALQSHPIKISPADISLDQKIRLLQTAYDVARQGPHVRQVSINYGERLKRVAVLNSDGESGVEDRVYVVFFDYRDRGKKWRYANRVRIVGRSPRV
jgi:TldD protein